MLPLVLDVHYPSSMVCPKVPNIYIAPTYGRPEVPTKGGKFNDGFVCFLTATSNSLSEDSKLT